MNQSSSETATVVALVGLMAIAVSMGIARFAFTPVLPMMEDDSGLTLVSAGWLAAANYIGYFAGAMSAAWVPRRFAIRGGLLLVALVTFAMGLGHSIALAMWWRLWAGITGAWVMIHVSAWALERLVALRRADAFGMVYAGAGIGIAATGLVAIVTMRLHWGPDLTWQIYGVAALLLAIATWRTFAQDPVPQRAADVPRRAARPSLHLDRDKLRIMVCYGLFGFGYIIPSTYLPAMAHQYISNPIVFGLAWPVFGGASAVFTLLIASRLKHFSDRRLWALCHIVMAVGVALPVLSSTLPAILVSSLLVGGTFMAIAMFALREAKRVAMGDATAMIAAVTAAFATGQIVGPLAVSAIAHVRDGFDDALLAAAVVLVLSAMSLWGSTRARQPVCAVVD